MAKLVAAFVLIIRSWYIKRIVRVVGINDMNEVNVIMYNIMQVYYGAYRYHYH